MAETIAELLVSINGDASGLESAINQVQAQLSGLEKSQTKANNATAKGTNQLSSYANTLSDTSKKWKDVGKGFDQVTKPLQYISAGLAAGGVASAKFAIDFEDNFANVKKTVDGTPEQMDALKQSIIDMTTVGINGHSAIPQTTAQLTELAAAGGQLGIKTENIADFTETMAQLGTATNLSGEQGAQTIAQFMNVTGVAQDKVSNLGSAIVDLGNNFATNEAKIADMAMVMGATGNVVGISAQDILGYSTALSSMGVDAEAGGSSVSRIWMEIQQATSAGGEDLEKFAELSGKSSEEFAKQWKTDASGAFNDFLTGLSKSDDQISTLSNLGFNNIRDIQALQRLASDQGLGLLTEALKRSNSAWSENNALQKEFDAKADTTASKMQITKNNLVEAGRSIGETFLPAIASGSETIANFAKGLANMSDSSKKTIAGVGTALIAVGAGTKVVSSGIKTIGNIIEGVNLIKGTQIGGAIAKGFAAIPLPAKLAVAGIAAVGIAGKVLYDNWYDNTYKWSEGMSESVDKVKESSDELLKIKGYQKELEDLKIVINSDESSQEQIEQAKSRVQEIAQLLGEEYHLNINTDTANIDEIEKAADKVAALKQVEYDNSVANYKDKLDKSYDKFIDKDGTYANTQAEYDNALNLQTAYGNLKLSLKDLTEQYEAGAISEKEYTDKSKAAIDTAKKAGADIQDVFESWDIPGAQLDAEKGWTAEGKKIDDLKKKLTDYDNAKQEHVATAEELAKVSLSQLGSNVESGDWANQAKNIEDIATAVKMAKLNADEYAKETSVVKQGISSLDEAFEKGGVTLDNTITDYMSLGKQFGMTTEQTVQGAALLKEGFTEVGQVGTESVGKVLRNLQQFGQSQGLEMTSQKLSSMAVEMGLIPDSKQISISASGDISIIDTASQKCKEIEGAGGVNVSVNADGNVEVLDTASGKIQELKDLGAVSVQVNANGDIEVLNEAGEVIATIDGKTAEVTITKDSSEVDDYEAPDQEATVNYEQGETPTEVPNASGKADYEVGNTPTNAPNISGNADYALGNHPTAAPTIHGEAVYTITYVGGLRNSDGSANIKWEKKAKGTQNFEGGLAMVNDETGISDNRELIVDGGKAFIPQGKNVILPLSKGAKVYTASQTKALMASMGIPRYAEGKDNSEGFKTAKDDWSHFTKTHAVTTTEELQKWVELSEEFTDNEKDVAEIQEEIFSLTQKITKELNDESEAWVEERNALNDWQSYGDSAIDAFNRVKERNYQAVMEGQQTWKDYTKTVSDIGKTMYEDRIDQSQDWLDHEQKYNDMANEDYIAGLERMKAYTQEYFNQGLIDYRTYVYGVRDINDKEFDTRKDIEDDLKDKNSEEFDNWLNDADAWYKMRSAYDDWGDFDDSEEKFYRRKLTRIQNFYQQGKIDFADYTRYMMDGNIDLFNAQSKMLDDALQKQSDYINDTRQQYSDEEQALRDSWTVSDRAVDMASVKADMNIYRSAVTNGGQEKYKDLQDQLKQLERDEQMYQLEQEHQDSLDLLQAQYDEAEAQKAVVLKNLRNSSIDITDYCESINDTANNYESVMTDLIDRVIMAINNVSVNIYNDNSTTSQTIAGTPSVGRAKYIQYNYG